MSAIERVKPFDSFTTVFRILTWAGFYAPLKTRSRLGIISDVYRAVAFLITFVYNVQHLIFAVQISHDMDKLLGSLMIVIPNSNLITKILTMHIQSAKLENVNRLIRGPYFAATDSFDKLIIQRNTSEMRRLATILIYGISVVGVFWFSSFYVKRYYDINEGVPSYVPFKADTWTKFSLSVFLECGPILWIGYGHISLDLLIATYYAQARTQLKIVKYHLGQFLNENKEAYNSDDNLSREFRYSDETDESIGERFKDIVKRFEKLVWYKTEIDIIFNISLSYQFFSSIGAVCLVIYRMTVVSVTSFPFIFLILLFFILLTQVFLYCYYGHMVEYESESVNDSLYKSEWLSLSVPFRRSLLIAMCRWSKPLKPRVCGIIPLSLNTFITILKTSYSLYTVLVAAQKN